MIAANSETYVVCFQTESYFDSLNLLKILLFLIIHAACRVDKKFPNTTKSVNLFPDHKRWKYTCMKYMSITKYIHCVTINKYIKYLLKTNMVVKSSIYLKFPPQPVLLMHKKKINNCH